MIKIEKLNKKYRSRKTKNYRALKNINLELPDTGLVFVVGKSGSGKSTLLNILGGLDNASSGRVIVDGNEITKFGERKFANYRNSHIGFIFQDYHLLDDLTIYENIIISLNLNRIEDNGLVLNALKRVGLQGYENRYPSELSGGERQRVAIARAIVKNPRIILADEPTGNLDHRTASSVIKLLKEISNNCLILIVSHNTNDAFMYADRIIELYYGQVLTDYMRNKDFIDDIVYQEDTLYYPSDKVLTKEDIEYINEGLKSNEIKNVVYVENKFIKHEQEELIEKHVEIKRNNLSFKEVFKLCMSFLKNKVSRIVSSSFMVSAIMVILALSQTIITFESSEALKEEIKDLGMKSLLTYKISSEGDVVSGNDNYHVVVDDDDYDKFIDLGYEGEIKPLINYTVPINMAQNFAGVRTKVMANSLYIRESLGTLCVDEDFFIDRIGSFELLARVDEFDSRGVFITDYLADAILTLNVKYLGKEYEDILGEYYLSTYTTVRGYINGIIKTNYKERHKEVINKVIDEKIKNLSKLYEDPNFIALSNEIYDYQGYSFTFNENFIKDNIENPLLDIAWAHKLVYNDVIVDENLAARSIVNGEKNKYKLKDNEVVMNFQKYNDIFKTNYDLSTISKFVPHTVKISQYRMYDHELKNQIFEKEVYIKKLDTANTSTHVSKEIFDLFMQDSFNVIGYYFNGVDNIETVLDNIKDMKYEQQSLLLDGVQTMARAVEVFIPIFELVGIVLCVGVVLILISFASKMIKDKMHDIGVLKAIGMKSRTIGWVFGLQIILIGLLTIVLSTVGYYLFIGLANDVLIESLKEFATSRIVLDADFLVFNKYIAHMDNILIVFLSMVAFIIPFIKVCRIKPVKIIKSKE